MGSLEEKETLELPGLSVQYEKLVDYSQIGGNCLGNETY